MKKDPNEMRPGYVYCNVRGIWYKSKLRQFGTFISSKEMLELKRKTSKKVQVMIILLITEAQASSAELHNMRENWNATLAPNATSEKRIRAWAKRVDTSSQSGEDWAIWEQFRMDGTSAGWAASSLGRHSSAAQLSAQLSSDTCKK